MFTAAPAPESSKTSLAFTKQIITGVSNVMHSDLKEEEIQKKAVGYHKLVRKYAHFFLYLLLGFLMMPAVFIFSRKGEPFKYLLIALLLCAVCAAGDEIHQIFVPGRSCELRDVLIDIAGSSLGCAVSSMGIFLIKRLRS